MSQDESTIRALDRYQVCVQRYRRLSEAERSDDLAREMGFGTADDPYIQGLRHGIGEAIAMLFGEEHLDEFLRHAREGEVVNVVRDTEEHLLAAIEGKVVDRATQYDHYRSQLDGKVAGVLKRIYALDRDPRYMSDGELLSIRSVGPKIVAEIRSMSEDNHPAMQQFEKRRLAKELIRKKSGLLRVEDV